jgi:hypothetical protein
VFVGGNRVVGDVDAAKEACMNAAATRGNATDGRAKTLQSFENCGCESMRQLANGKKKPGDPGFVTEEEFFYDQVVKGNAEVPLTDAEVAQMNKRCEPLMKAAGDAHAAADPFNPTPEQLARIEEADRAVADCTGKFKADIARKNAKRRAMSGGTNLKTRDAMSKGTPYETEQKLPDIPTALEGVGTGKGVVMPMNGMPMANGKTTGGHIVVITGVVVDDDGNPVSVIYNDSFNGCAVTMPAGDFDAKIQKDGATNITKKPVW